jgi:transcriptional regulator with XRE-family HTH domain
MTKEQLGDFVNQQRILQNYTQKELAEKVGCRRQVIIEIENSQCDYGITMLVRVLKALSFDLVPSPYLSNTTKVDRILYNFNIIEPAKPEDDPSFQIQKKNRIFAHKTSHKKTTK